MHDGIAERRAQCGFDQVRIAVPEHMHADAVDHVPLDRTVRQFDERAVADTGADVGIQRWTPAQFPVLRQSIFVGLFQIIYGGASSNKR